MRPAISKDVMDRDDEYVVFDSETKEPGAEHRTAHKVERFLCLTTYQLLESRLTASLDNILEFFDPQNKTIVRVEIDYPLLGSMQR